MRHSKRPPTWNLGFALSRLGNRVRLAFIEALAAWNLRPAHYGVLATLASCQSSSQRELAAATGIDRGDLVGLLDTLEQRGLARRVRDDGDRRRYSVHITDAGQAVVGELNAVAVEVNDAFFSPLSASERAQLETLLAKLWDADAVPTPWGRPRASDEDRAAAGEGLPYSP